MDERRCASGRGGWRVLWLLGGMLIAVMAGGAARAEPAAVSLRFLAADGQTPTQRLRAGEFVWIELRLDGPAQVPSYPVRLRDDRGEAVVMLDRSEEDPARFVRRVWVGPPYDVGEAFTPPAEAGDAPVIQPQPGIAVRVEAMEPPPAERGRLVVETLDAAGAPQFGFFWVFRAEDAVTKVETERAVARGRSIYAPYVDLEPGVYDVSVQGHGHLTYDNGGEWHRGIKVEAGSVVKVRAGGPMLGRVYVDVANPYMHDHLMDDWVGVNQSGARLIFGPPGSYVDGLPGEYEVGYYFGKWQTQKVRIEAGQTQRITLTGEHDGPRYLASPGSSIREGRGRLVLDIRDASGRRAADGMYMVRRGNERIPRVHRRLGEAHVADLPPDTYRVSLVGISGNGQIAGATGISQEVTIREGAVHRVTLGGPDQLGRVIVRVMRPPGSPTRYATNPRYLYRDGEKAVFLQLNRLTEVQAGAYEIGVGPDDDSVRAPVVVQAGRLSEVVVYEPPPADETPAPPPPAVFAEAQVARSEPVVRFVRPLPGGRFEPTTDPLVYGEPFMIEAEYEDPPGRPSVEAAIDWIDAEEAELTLLAVPEQPRLYRSPPIHLRVPQPEAR